MTIIEIKVLEAEQYLCDMINRPGSAVSTGGRSTGPSVLHTERLGTRKACQFAFFHTKVINRLRPQRNTRSWVYGPAFHKGVQYGWKTIKTITRAQKTKATEDKIYYDIVVVGGGAAGLSAAYWAARHAQGSSVVVLEKMNEAGKKILISGGTRCNILPAVEPNVESDFFSESSLSALRACFRQWSYDECKNWLIDDIGIELCEEKESEKLFPCSNDARTARDALIRACHQLRVELYFGSEIVGLRMVNRQDNSKTYEQSNFAGLNARNGSEKHPLNGNNDGSTASEGIWEVMIKGKKNLIASKVILATGGKSFPSLGTVGDGWTILQQLGHSLNAPYPALTPLKGIHPGGDCNLAGISVQDATLSAEYSNRNNSKRSKRKIEKAYRSALLFTHRGFSGPAILDLSHRFTMLHHIQTKKANRMQAQSSQRDTRHVTSKPVLKINWKENISKDQWDAILNTQNTKGSTAVTTILHRQGIPSRLCDALCSDAGLPKGRKIAEIRREERKRLIDSLVESEITITGDEGYPKAEVTGGGIPLNELNCSTMESRIASGLYVCGELCDIHGRIGGFNFYFAWVSGRTAGIGAAMGLGN